MSTKIPPKCYAYTYLLLIPVFALIYSYFPGASIKCSLEHTPCGLYQAAYYSAVTITTLGYGDISPANSLTQFFAGLEAILGVVVIGMFLTALSGRQSEFATQVERNKEADRQNINNIALFRNHNLIIKMAIEECTKYAFEVTTTIGDRNKTPETSKLNPNFTLNDMRDLFQPTLLMTDSSAQPAVYYYFRSINSFVAEVQRMVLAVDLRKWPDFEKSCLSFIKICKTLDHSEQILSHFSQATTAGPIKNMISTLIAEHSGPVENKHSNIINAYVALFHLITHQLMFAGNYTQAAAGILNESAPA